MYFYASSFDARVWVFWIHLLEYIYCKITLRLLGYTLILNLWKELEKIQDKYIKWTLKTDKTTPRHILHEKTRR